MRPITVTLLLCGAEILGLSGMATFSALLPLFLDAWRLTNTQAGWLSAVYYGAYVVAVPVLTFQTDRWDAKYIILFGLAVGAVSCLGFAWLASGFLSAAMLRFMAGVSLAGVYMPGLKLLSDHVDGPMQSRYVSFYTASFSLGASLSYLMAGEANELLGWRWAFAVAGISSLVGFLLVAFAVPGGKKSSCEPSLRIRVSIVRVAREKEAMAYILGYAAHMWELFGMRSWIVAFLAFSANLQGVATPVLSPTRVAALINLVGLPASIGGNELCRRFGRKKTIARIMVGSSLLSVAVGLSAPLPYNLVVCLGLLYGVFVVADSASLTAGAVINSPAGGRGATLAVHSTMGFGAAFLGPLAVGIVLDLLRNNPSAAWAAAFATMGAGCALGPVALFGLKKTKL